METREEEKLQEKDFLAYTGNTIPRVIRLVWTLVIVFGLYYCIKFVWPDLVQWIQRTK